VAQTLQILPAANSPVSGASLSTASGYQSGLSGGFNPTSVWYFDVHALRVALEAALVPGVPASSVTQYNADVLPLLAPIKTVAGSAGTNKNGLAISTFAVGISAASEWAAAK
jgi:hypothetical protein